MKTIEAKQGIVNKGVMEQGKKRNKAWSNKMKSNQTQNSKESRWSKRARNQQREARK